MAKVCEVCGRGPQFGNRISHAHNVTKRRWNLNLQSVRAVVKGAAKAHSRLHLLHPQRQSSEGRQSSKTDSRIRSSSAHSTYSMKFVTFQEGDARPEAGVLPAIV